MDHKRKDFVMVPAVGPLPGGPAAPPGIRPTDEREPGTRKHCTPNDAPPERKRSSPARKAPPPNAPHSVEQTDGET